MAHILTDSANERGARRLLRLLPAAIDHGRVRVDGVRVEVTPSDIAAAMSGLPSIAVHIARALILGDGYAVESIRFWLLASVIELSHRDGWGAVPWAQKQAIANIVAADIFPPKCGTCRGRKLAPDERGAQRQCPECEGVGEGRVTAADKAARVGVGESAWHATWRDRAGKLMAHYERHEGQCVERIVRRLGY